MGSGNKLKTKIQGMIDHANSVTGKNHKTLLSAHNDLISGYTAAEDLATVETAPVKYLKITRANVVAQAGNSITIGG